MTRTRQFTLTSLLGLLLALLSLQPVLAETASPKALLEDVTREMIHALNTRQDEIRKDPQVAREVVEELLLPHLDLITSSRWVLGRHWRDASQEQKLEFIRHFRAMLLQFYSGALAEYLKTNHVDQNLISFLPLRQGNNPEDVTVHSEVHPPNGSSIKVNYQMHLTRNGWKVYDVTVEGISVVTTYRTSFANEIRQHGLDGLIARLADRNSDLVQAPPTGSL
jgi:phospholipid transport system substrate-binding protein